MANAKIIMLSEIINNAYKKYAENKTNWAKTLSKRLFQVDNYNDEQKNYFKISFKKNMKLLLAQEILKKIGADAEKVLSFRKISKSISNEKNFFKEIYGWIYITINNKIEKIIGNPKNHLMFSFDTKKELTTKINESKEIGKSDKEKLINCVWNKLK